MMATKTKPLSKRQVQRIAKALADPRRMEILEQIGSCKCMRCADLREHQPISAATLSHHMKELEAAGLIEIAREGKYARMTLRKGILNAYLEYLARI